MSIACALPCLLAACGAADRVIVKPVSLPPVAPALLQDIPRPKCDLAAREAYPPDDLEAERLCLQRAGASARKTHAALAAAVRIRERAAEAAAKAAQ